MDNSIIAYIQRLELLTFFSGYPLIYYFIQYVSGYKTAKNNFKSRLITLMPFSYGLLGILYLGLLLKNLQHDYSIEHIKSSLQQPFLITWGISSLLFWLPAIRQKPVYSLLHSLVFFFFIIRDILFRLVGFTTENDIVRNDMKIYTTSLFLNLASFTLIVFISFQNARYKKHREI